MNHARWQTKFADRRKETELDAREITQELDPYKTPAITHKLLEIDEEQLDLLTGQRADIFKGRISRTNTMPDHDDEELPEAVRSHEPILTQTNDQQAKTYDNRNEVSLQGAQSALVEGNKGLSLGDAKA